MNNEIKEIIDKLKLLCYDDYSLEVSVDYIRRKAEKILLDYITNLQEENERLNNIITELDTFLKNKIDNFDKDVKDTILHEQMTIKVIYDYLQIVKGDSSNE